MPADVASRLGLVEWPECLLHPTSNGLECRMTGVKCYNIGQIQHGDDQVNAEDLKTESVLIVMASETHGSNNMSRLLWRG